MALDTQSLPFKGDDAQDAVVVSLDEYSPFQHVTPPLSKSSSSPPRLLRDYRTKFYPKAPLGVDLAELYSENILAKIYRTAIKTLPEAARSSSSTPDQDWTPVSEHLPASYPEYVPQDGDQNGLYVHREPDFWTCGFFPGTLHDILERLVRFPKSVQLPARFLGAVDSSLARAWLRSEVSRLCRLWAEPLHAMADRTDTHDIGFIVMPALRQSWELTGDARSLDSIIRAARSLASRYVPAAGAIRSWDTRIQKNIQITCMDENLILIIDSMCNLDLLYYAASHSTGRLANELYDIATAHATTLLRTHLRPEPIRATSSSEYRGPWYSVHHVANLDPKTGDIKRQFTAQGYSDTSTWARGQAWGILGYAQTYMWTKDKKFLQASCGIAEHFLHRLETEHNSVDDAGFMESTIDGASCMHHGGRYVPPWDFDAPVEDPSNPTKDSSAGAIAANGMLVLSQGLAGLGYHQLATRFRRSAIDIVRDLINFAVAPEKARLVVNGGGEDAGTALRISVEDAAPTQTFEGIMKFGTANNNENAKKKYANHGLVYGDYYLVEFGNRLLRMGLD